MKEELTTAMHSEFSVSNETEIKHRVWSVLSRSEREGNAPEDYLERYDLTKDQLEKHKPSYFELR